MPTPVMMALVDSSLLTLVIGLGDICEKLWRIVLSPVAQMLALESVWMMLPSLSMVIEDGLDVVDIGEAEVVIECADVVVGIHCWSWYMCEVL